MAGRARLLVYQIRGHSRGPIPGWRLIDVERIEGLVVLDEHFAGSRGRSHQAHKRWNELYCRVE